MKKLLSLLSVLTISGSGIPTTIAASPYKYEVENNKEINKNIDFIPLKRAKREDIDLFNVITDTQLDTLENNYISTIISRVKERNNLYDDETYTVKNVTDSSAEFWVDSNPKYYKQWSWKKVYFRVMTEREQKQGNIFAGNSSHMEFWFTPSLWEEIIVEWYNSKDINNFKLRFKNKLNEYYQRSEYSYWQPYVTWSRVIRFAENLWNNWDNIIKVWRTSDKQNRMNIVSDWYGNRIWANIWLANIGDTDDQGFVRKNKYINKQLIPEIITNITLGDILIKGDTKDETAILEAIKKHNPNVDISQIYVGTNPGEKTTASAKIIVKEFSNKYNFKDRNWVLVHFNLKYE